MLSCQEPSSSVLEPLSRVLAIKKFHDINKLSFIHLYFLPLSYNTLRMFSQVYFPSSCQYLSAKSSTFFGVWFFYSLGRLGTSPVGSGWALNLVVDLESRRGGRARSWGGPTLSCKTVTSLRLLHSLQTRGLLSLNKGKWGHSSGPES